MDGLSEHPPEGLVMPANTAIKRLDKED